MSDQEATKATHDIEKKKSVREIAFKLTDAELLAKGVEAADVRLLKESVDAEFGRVKATYKGKLESAEFQLSNILAIIKAKEDKRVVNVEDHFDYTAGVVTTFFEEKKVAERVMTNDERQQGLPFVDKKHAAELADKENAAAEQ